MGTNGSSGSHFAEQLTGTARAVGVVSTTYNYDLHCRYIEGECAMQEVQAAWLLPSFCRKQSLAVTFRRLPIDVRYSPRLTSWLANAGR